MINSAAVFRLRIPRFRPALVLLVAAWFAVTLAATAFVFYYESLPGRSLEPPLRWPPNAPISPSPAGHTLLMFAHPRCPCTRASLSELAVISAILPPHQTARVYFYRPDSAADLWQETDIVRQAAAIPQVQVAWDDGGRFAAYFHAHTSGHVLFYDADGTLKFSGGITPLRGHAGWNEGRAAVAALGRGGKAEPTRTPVFGCGLTLPGDCGAPGGRERSP